jgi:predicted Zn-dependent protease
MALFACFVSSAGHASEGNNIDFMLRGLEIFILALDPTEGLLSLGVATFLASTREALTAANSREHETEADELGVKLAAMACFNTVRGAEVFRKMHEFDVAQGHAGKNLMSSHPASSERYENVKMMSADENLAKYSYCNGLRAKIGRALTIAQIKLD